MSLIQGDDQILDVFVAGLPDVSGVPAATYSLFKQVGETAIFTKTIAGGGIALAGDHFEVTIDSADTAAIFGTHYHELETEDGAGNQNTVVCENIQIKHVRIP